MLSESAYQFVAGELLFLGGSGDETAALEFVQPNLGLAANPKGPGVHKKGHEYLWVHYEDDSAETIVKRPVAVCAQKVCEEGDFNPLRISIPPAVARRPQRGREHTRTGIVVKGAATYHSERRAFSPE